jgi:putative phosphoesterase
MKIAVIGDLHSNHIALEAVLKDVKQKKVDFILGTGDLVGYLPFPNEVVTKVREANIFCVQGNHDEVIAKAEPVTKAMLEEVDPSKRVANASRLYTNYVLTDENRTFLKGLPKELVLQFEGLSIRVVHGGLEGNKQYMHPEEEILYKAAKILQEDVLISGHTHIPYYKKIEGKHFVNAGSAGKPKHGSPHATYVVLHLVAEALEVEIVEVPYPTEKIVEAIRQNELISNDLIQALEKGV